jgi:hypothetical protein
MRLLRLIRAFVALGVGGEDLATDLGAEPTPDALTDLPKRLGLIAARGAGDFAAGLDPGTVAGLKDTCDGRRATLRRSGDLVLLVRPACILLRLRSWMKNMVRGLRRLRAPSVRLRLLRSRACGRQGRGRL